MSTERYSEGLCWSGSLVTWLPMLGDNTPYRSHRQGPSSPILGLVQLIYNRYSRGYFNEIDYIVTSVAE